MNKLTVKSSLILLLATTISTPLYQGYADTTPEQKETIVQKSEVSLSSWMPDPILRNFVVEQFSQVFQKHNLDINNVSKEVFYNTLQENGESSTLYVGGQNLPLIQSTEGISVFSNVAVNLSATEGWVSHFIYNPINWNMLLQTDTNPVTGKNVSMASIMDMNIDGRLDAVFPNGIDMSFLFDNFNRVGFDPHNILMNKHVTNLTNENYESFDVSFSDLGITNIVGMEDTHFVSVSVPMKDGSYINYTGSVGKESIHFTLDTPIKDYDTQLDGLVISPNDDDVNFPSTPYAQIYFNQYNEDQTKSLNGYINVPINLSYSKVIPPVAKGQVTVKHIYNSSIQPDTTEVLSGDSGTEYTTEARPTGKFHLLKVEGETKGLFPEPDKPIAVTYYYTASDVNPPVDPEPPVKPTEPTTPTTPSKPAIDVDVDNSTVNNNTTNSKNNLQVKTKSNVSIKQENKVKDNNKKETLPKTGDNASSIVSVGLGVVLIILAFVFYNKFKKKD